MRVRAVDMRMKQKQRAMRGKKKFKWERVKINFKIPTASYIGEALRGKR